MPEESGNNEHQHEDWCIPNANASNCSLETKESDEAMDVDKETPGPKAFSALMVKLQSGLQNWLQKLAERRRAAKYSKDAPISSLPTRTQQHKKRKIQIDTAKLRRNRFQDIRTIFKQQTTDMIREDIIDLSQNEPEPMECEEMPAVPAVVCMGEEKHGDENCGDGGRKEPKTVDTLNKSVHEEVHEAPFSPMGYRRRVWMEKEEEEEVEVEVEVRKGSAG